MNKILKWIRRKLLKRQAKKGIAFLEKYHLREELDAMIDYAMETFGDAGPLILAEFLQFVMEHRDTFDSEEEYARWLGWQIKQYRGTMLQWAQGPD